MTIANDYEPNYDFITCQQWIEWINNQEIKLGQPAVKEDKGSRLMDLHLRVKQICLVQPANIRFNPEIRRLYLPRSAEQFMEFLTSLGIAVTIVTSKFGYNVRELKTSFEEADKDLMRIFGKLTRRLKEAKVVK